MSVTKTNYFEGVECERLTQALTWMGCATPASMEDLANQIPDVVNKLTSAVLRHKQFAQKISKSNKPLDTHVIADLQNVFDWMGELPVTTPGASEMAIKLQKLIHENN